MNRAQILGKVSIGHILRFDHPSGKVPLVDPIECSDSYAVSFVEQGRFSLLYKRQEILYQNGDVLLSYPGTTRRFGHPGECGDDVCLSVHFSPEVVRNVFMEDVSGLPKLQASGRTMFLAWQIRRALECNESVWVESAILEALSALLTQASQWKPLFCRETQFRFYAKRIAEAKELLDQSFDQNHSLLALGRSVGMSVFHFHRIFRQLVGITPHQYLLRRRLMHSLSLLKQGSAVTRAALDSGFNNHGYFSRTFKKSFGITPREYAKTGRIQRMSGAELTPRRAGQSA